MIVNDADVHSLVERTPDIGDDVFVFDACYGEWVYAEYQGIRVGRFVFLEGNNSYGEPIYSERPTHFCEVSLPGKPV